MSDTKKLSIKGSILRVLKLIGLILTLLLINLFTLQHFNVKEKEAAYQYNQLRQLTEKADKLKLWNQLPGFSTSSETWQSEVNQYDAQLNALRPFHADQLNNAFSTLQQKWLKVKSLWLEEQPNEQAVALALIEWETSQNQLLQASGELYHSREAQVGRTLWVLLLADGLLLAAFLFVLTRFYLKPLQQLQVQAQAIGEGKLTNIDFPYQEDEVGMVAKTMTTLVDHLKNAGKFIHQIGDGKLEAQYDYQNALDRSEEGLSAALVQMQGKLKQVAQDEEIRKWSAEGQAEFVEILRAGQDNLQNLTDGILAKLVHYVGGCMGAVYILEEQKDTIQMQSCYAYDRKKYVEESFKVGEGLVGQSMLEKHTYYMREIPSDYFKLATGLGHALPDSLLIVPMVLNEKVLGAIEVSSLKEFASYQIEFIEKLAESLASTIHNAKNSEETRHLLEESQLQAEKLRAQEEEMRQNMEELSATQEEMHRKEVEMIGQLDAINLSNATIEFTPKGNILRANDLFLNLMGYTMDDIVGKHHQIFVTAEERNTEAYGEFWQKLAQGAHFEGEFKRLSRQGNIVWIKGVYCPVKDASGEVVKIIKLANDITDQKEAQESLKGQLEAIDLSTAMIEFKPDGTILKANQRFLDLMGYAEEEIVGKHHQVFVTAKEKNSEAYAQFWNKLGMGEHYQGAFQRIDRHGNAVWIEGVYCPFKDENGKVVKVIKLAADITNRKRAEEDLKGQLEAVDLSTAMIEFKPDGTILNANQRFLELMGYTLDEVKGKHHRMFVTEEERKSIAYKQFWNRLSTGEHYQGAFQRIDSHGNTVWIEGVYCPVMEADGKVYKIVKLASDITAQKEMEKELNELLKEVEKQKK